RLGHTPYRSCFGLLGNCRHRHYGSRVLQKQYIQPQKDAAAEGGEVALIVGDLELSDKEKAHSSNAENDRGEVAEVEFFADNERPEQQNVDRRRVLQKDRVG